MRNLVMQMPKMLMGAELEEAGFQFLIIRNPLTIFA